METPSIWSTITGFFGGIQDYLIVGSVTLALGLAGGTYAGYRWELGTYEKLVASDAQTQTEAVNLALNSLAAQAIVGTKWAVADQQARDGIQTQTITLLQRIPTYVHDKIACPGPTVGLARVLRAAAEGVAPDTLQLAAGQSDDDCSDFAPTEVAGWFSAYAGASRGNATQLNDLEAWALADHAAQVVK